MSTTINGIATMPKRKVEFNLLDSRNGWDWYSKRHSCKEGLPAGITEQRYLLEGSHRQSVIPENDLMVGPLPVDKPLPAESLYISTTLKQERTEQTNVHPGNATLRINGVMSREEWNKETSWQITEAVGRQPSTLPGRPLPV